MNRAASSIGLQHASGLADPAGARGFL